MTSTIQRPEVEAGAESADVEPTVPGRRPSDSTETAAGVPADEGRGPRLGERMRQWASLHGRTLVYLLPVLAIAGLVQGINMGGSPQRIDDEGTYTAQAWAVDTLGSLTHYTYWYDHPPLGWIQIAGYAKLTGAFARYDIAVIAAREAMLVATLIAVVLIFLLARRIGMRRGTSAAAALIFAVSPLAVQFHRTVYLDNVATPWLLGAFLLAMTRRRQLAGFAGAAAAFGIAVLSKETYLLALPFLAWVMWRSANKETRRYTLSVAASILTLFGFSYVLLALVKGELFPSRGHVSLVDGIAFQLGSRQSSGSIFDPGSLIDKNFAMWWHLDPVIITFGALAAVVALFIRRLRPFGALLVALMIFMLRPGGYLPVPYVIMLLPFAALVIAGVCDTVWHAFQFRRRFPVVPSVLWGVAVLAAVAVAVPVWTVQLRGLLLADLDRPTRQAEQWVETNVPHDSRLIVDDAMWVDLVRHGFARDNVVWYYKVDTDSAVEALSPDGWKDSDYVVTTDSMRTFNGAFPRVDAAIKNSVRVATFGSGTQAVDIRRIDPGGASAAKAVTATNGQAAETTGKELAQNPRLTVAAAERQALITGHVDPRVSVVLGQLLAEERITVTAFPRVPGETAAGARKVLITSAGGRSTQGGTAAAHSVASVLRDASGLYKPSSVELRPDGVLATYPTASITDLSGQ